MNKKTEKILLLVTDFVTINITWFLFFYLRVNTGWFELISQPDFFLPMIAVYIYWLLIFIFVGMYRTWFALSRFDEISTLFKASFVGIFILFFLIVMDDYSTNGQTSFRLFILLYWGIFLFFVGSGRLFVRSLQRRLLINGIGRRKALIVGFNDKAREILHSIKRHPEFGLDVVAFIAAHKGHVGKSHDSIEVKGVIDELEKIIEQNDIRNVIIALDKHDEELIIKVIDKCDSTKVEIKMIADLYDIISGQARILQLYGSPLIDVMPELMPEWEKKIKRIMDIVFSLLLLIVTSPATILAAIAIKLESEGPVFYKQERVGMNGKIFKIIKFRTMIKDAEKHTGPVWSSKGDPRITKVGKFLRKVRLDEIPQAINVLKGDMSFVGPRPERPYFVEKLSKEIPLYKRRLKVRPGLTGWAQVKHKYDESIEDVKIKLRYDLFYIENMSLRLDFKIILRTVFVVLFGKGHYE